MVEEFCTGETFRPRCVGGRNDVIVMLTARYGRMKFGRCLEEEPGFASMMDNPRFIGCSADVKSVIDRQCSGQSECDVRINDQNFDGVKPTCFANLKMYLDASYMCIQGRVFAVLTAPSTSQLSTISSAPICFKLRIALKYLCS